MRYPKPNKHSIAKKCADRLHYPIHLTLLKRTTFGISVSKNRTLRLRPPMTFPFSNNNIITTPCKAIKRRLRSCSKHTSDDHPRSAPIKSPITPSKRFSWTAINRNSCWSAADCHQQRARSSQEQWK